MRKLARGLILAVLAVSLLGATPAWAETIPGDINGDCVVDLTDLERMLASFGSTRGQAWYPHSDINHDGVVDLDDFAILLSNFGASCVHGNHHPGHH